MNIEPHRVAKLSGIGCSSKTPDYFLGNSHGFNTVHGRMPSVLTGANLANRDLLYLGVSGDGDSASIGLGQFAHAMRRAVNMVYILENNGVYGLTKGQFSATADKGSSSKKGVANSDSPIDTASLALLMGASFVGRSFSGDKQQLVPLIKAAIGHRGAAFIDVVSPCVAFNNHPGSTKSYDYVRAHNEAVNRLDVIEGREEITTEGGLDVVGQRERVRACVEVMSAAGIVTSLFIDPDDAAIEASAAAKAPWVELHTGAYANAYYGDRRAAEFQRLRLGAVRAHDLGLTVNAGHGINYVNIAEVRTLPHLHELNIGHSLISRALFTGIEEAVREMKVRMNP
jgi:pyruvate/2-oxoacid:ferredoxin oxidoreductase beta subunit